MVDKEVSFEFLVNYLCDGGVGKCVWVTNIPVITSEDITQEEKQIEKDFDLTGVIVTNVIPLPIVHPFFRLSFTDEEAAQWLQREPKLAT